MKNLKNTIAAITLMAVMGFGATFANAGIIIAGATEAPRTTTRPKAEDPCSEKSEKKDWGIIIAGLRGIIIAGLGGIIIAGANNTPTECGIIIAG